MIKHGEAKLLTDVRARLVHRFDTLSSATVNATFDDVVGRFDGDPIREFVPLLVERIASTELAIRS